MVCFQRVFFCLFKRKCLRKYFTAIYVYKTRAQFTPHQDQTTNKRRTRARQLKLVTKKLEVACKIFGTRVKILRFVRSFNFEITRKISDQIALHSFQLPLLILYKKKVLDFDWQRAMQILCNSVHLFAKMCNPMLLLVKEFNLMCYVQLVINEVGAIIREPH